MPSNGSTRRSRITTRPVVHRGCPVVRDILHDPRWLPFLRQIGKAPEQLAAIKFDVTVPK